MDLALLKAEIARKKEATASKVLKDSGAKYFRRGDLLKAQEEEYRQEQRAKEAERLAKLQASSKAPALSVNEEIMALEESAAPAIPEAEVRRRLRDLGEPIILFGETLDDTRRRLRELEVNADTALDSRNKNDFMRAMEEVDEKILNEMLEHQANAEAGITTSKARPGNKYSMESLVPLVAQLNEGDTDKDQSTVRKFIKFLLELWKEDLDKRSDADKTSGEGKFASATCLQTEEYLRPLLRHLKNKDTPPDILQNLCIIIKEMSQREYIRASDAYYRMAIGNAPWPIGVTNVGIHSRTGREKIFAQHIAHVLNDEVQRKYIQGLKRLMTYCQKRFPTDPSKCLEYKAVQGALYGNSSEQ